MNRLFIVCLAALTMTLGSAHAAGPTIPAVDTPVPPKIDGDLSDPCWQTAPSVSDFYFLPDGSRAVESTTARICYDRQNVYVAFQCKDTSPDRIVAEQKKRGGDIDTDDWVGFDLDTYNTFQSSKMSSVKVSAGGVQVEQLQSGDVSKIEWKGDWSAATKRLDDGYSVEIAIPFDILQYDPATTTMGVAFIRRQARSEQEWWAPNIGQGEDPKNYFVWEGLNLPRPAVKPVILGYSLFGMGDDSASRVGLDVKHALTPSLTGAFTANPDFRNVEQDVESIDFTYTEKYLPDNRPFFQEGSMYFPGSNLFYSRQIEQIDFGGKLSGRYNDLQVAALHCGQFGQDEYSMLHIGREWPAKGNIRLVGVLSDTSTTHNLATGITGGYRVYDKNGLKMHLATKLLSADAASGKGRGKLANFSLYNSGKPRVLAWQIDRTVIDPDFDPYLGYIPEKGMEGWQIWAMLHDELAQGKLSEWRWNVNADLMDRTGGSLFYNTLSTDCTWSWRKGRSIRLTGMTSQRIPKPGDPTYHDRKVGISYLWGTRNLYDRGGFGIDIGRMSGGSYLSYGLGQAWQAGRNLSVSLDYYYTRIKPPSPDAFSANQVIAALAYDIDNERTLASRLVAQSGSVNIYLAYKQRVRAGMDIYVIYGDPNALSTRNALLLKLIRPM